MSFRWSFSTDKLFRRCQRQFFFREIAAHHSQKEPWRREAFVLRQLKTLELWRGSVIHEGTRLPTFTIGLLKRQVKHLRAADSTRIRRQFSIVMLATRKSATALCRCAN
jgi:hypothetical protein